jgi:hypothetical protein
MTRRDLHITWLNVQGAANYIGKSRRTIYNWLRAGKLHWRRGASGTVLIDEASLWQSYAGPRVPWVFVGKGVYEGRSRQVLRATQRELRSLLEEIVDAVDTGSPLPKALIERAREVALRAD